MHFTDYDTAMRYIIHEVPKTSRQVFNDTATIEKNRKVMELLGNPQNSHPSVHVAATSGKGSICHLIEAILRVHGKTTGMILSPHVYDIRERIQINGDLIDEEVFTKTLNDVLRKTKNSHIRFSYFEILVAMGFTVFASSQLDYAIIETGFGGRLDATNVITRSNKIAVLGQIGFDHTEALGNTLEKIATEKAGIVQNGNHVIALKQSPEVNKVYKKRCLEQNATLEWVQSSGDYRKDNEAIARKVCYILAERDKWKIDDVKINSAISSVFIPGRFEKRQYKDRLAVLDGAHNPQKLAALADRIKREGLSPATIVLALGERKDLTSCLSVLQPIAKRIIATEYFTEEQDIPRRPIAAQEIVKVCEELEIEVQISRSPKDALATAMSHQEPILITGSFYLLDELEMAL